ncbi:MAG: hypothetical protein Q8J69_06125 [Sphingobacteriaceae bacterium]|nr:hypothetical protein [Sphingobacteriaceae bacterium]
MNEQLQPITPSDEISLKELIQKLQATLTYLWGYRWRLMLMGLLGGALGFGYAHFFKKVLYTSHLTFIVEEKTAGGGNLMGLASQFGLDLGGGGGGMFSSDNLILLLRSQKILESALLEPKPELENNHLLNAYLQNNYSEALEKGKIKLIPTDKERKAFTRAEDSTLAIVISQIQKSTQVNKLDKKASIIDLKLTDTNELWAFLMSQLIIEKATEMYLELKTGKTSRTVAILESRVDSVKKELDVFMGSAALEADQNQSLVLMRARVPAAKKQIQIQMLTAMYGELVKNLELTKFTLEREEPVIQIIDQPNLPLNWKGQGRQITAVVVGFLLFILAALWFLIKKWWYMPIS